MVIQVILEGLEIVDILVIQDSQVEVETVDIQDIVVDQETVVSLERVALVGSQVTLDIQVSVAILVNPDFLVTAVKQ